MPLSEQELNLLDRIFLDMSAAWPPVFAFCPFMEYLVSLGPPRRRAAGGEMKVKQYRLSRESLLVQPSMLTILNHKYGPQCLDTTRYADHF